MNTNSSLTQKTTMATSRNFTAHFDEDLCKEEQRSNTMYIVTLSLMEALAIYFYVSLVLSFHRSPPPTSRPENQSCFKIQYTTLLRGLLQIVIIVISVRIALDIIQLALGDLVYDAFGEIYITKAALSTVTNACVYSFLWLRQWLLYSQPILREVKTKCFKVGNISVLILVTTLVAVGPVLDLRNVLLDLTEDGCMLVLMHNWGLTIAIYTGFSISYQIVLLGFFIYPLKRARSHEGKEIKTTTLPIVKRCVISASVCFINELVFTVVHNLISRPVMLNTISMDLKYIIYYICLVASYNDWLNKVCLPCTIKVTPDTPTSRAATDTKYSTDDLECKSHDEGD